MEETADESGTAPAPTVYRNGVENNITSSRPARLANWTAAGQIGGQQIGSHMTTGNPHYPLRQLQVAGLAVLLALLMVAAAQADNSKVSYPPVPDWVQELPWTTPTNAPASTNSAGTRYLVFECQDRPKHAESFVRMVALMENDTGVQNSGSLQFGFAPQYEELCLHRVVIHRGSQTIDRLNPAKVRIIQPEPELNGHVFNGRQTAVLFVEDLRVGDILEYAYSIRGANPALAGHYARRFVVESDSPTDRQRFRVLWDDTTPLHQRLHLTNRSPDIQKRPGQLDYAWCFTNVAPLTTEDYQPISYQPYSTVEVSDFADWQSVVNWALPLYDVSPTNLPPEMRDLIAKWQSSASSLEEKARWALEFVQDQLRYTGIESGPDSYQPADPVDTFVKRYGDCKGKVALLHFLLQQMDIESYPALVSFSDHEAIADRLPSPMVFDHAILQVKLFQRTIWVDPTSSHQGGLLWRRHISPFGKALVLWKGNDALEDIDENEGGQWRQIATSTFSIKNYDAPVSLTVRTEYHDASADEMRDNLTSNDPKELAKTYLNFYARIYPGITSLAPLKFSDNRQQNSITMEEAYVITNFWKKDAANKLWLSTYLADNLHEMLTDPGTRLRKTPLALAYPMIRQQKILVLLPDTDWSIPDLTSNIENTAFSFTYHRQLRDSTVAFEYECRTKLRAIPAEAVAGFLADREHFEDLLNVTLHRPAGKPTFAVNWVMVILALFGATGMAGGSVWFWLRTGRNPTAPPMIPGQTPAPHGLGGWLILVGIGLSIAPFLRIYHLCAGWNGYFSADVWQAVAMPQGESYHPLYGPLLVAELLANIILFELNLLALCLFFAKRAAFPTVFIGLALGNSIFIVLDSVGCFIIPALRANAFGQTNTEIIRTVIWALVWTGYMLKSRRVKATFTR